MKLEYYSPTFRNVLLIEKDREAKKGSIYIPTSAFIPDEEKVFLVVKVGKDCVEVKEGDSVKLMAGIRPQEIELEGTFGKGVFWSAGTDAEMTPNHIWSFRQVMEQQIVGIFRVNK